MDLARKLRDPGFHQQRKPRQFAGVDPYPGVLHARQNSRQRQLYLFVEL